MKDTFYFIMHPAGDISTVQVCDLQIDMAYSKDDWRIAVNKDFYLAEKACKYARAIAAKYNLEYAPFESRYGDPYVDEVPYEGMYLTLDEERNL